MKNLLLKSSLRVALLAVTIVFLTFGTRNACADDIPQEERREFVELHAAHAATIQQSRDQFHARLQQIRQRTQGLTASRYQSYRQAILTRVGALEQMVGNYGVYSITTAQQVKLLIPNEDRMDDIIDRLEEIADDLEEFADDSDDDNVEDLADDLEDLIDSADRLEDRLTRKTNALARAWRRKGGDLGFIQ